MLLKSRQKVLNTNELVSLLDDIATKQQEHFIVISLSSSMELIAKHLVFLGTVNATLSHPREIFAVAIKDRASNIVISHNHPSGDPIPSDEDIKATQQIVAAGILMGIPVRDHIIVAKGSYYSFAANGLL